MSHQGSLDTAVPNFLFRVSHKAYPELLEPKAPVEALASLPSTVVCQAAEVAPRGPSSQPGSCPQSDPGTSNAGGREWVSKYLRTWVPRVSQETLIQPPVPP